MLKPYWAAAQTTTKNKELHMKIIHWLAVLLVLLGGVNWGLIALGNFNLINAIVSHIPISHLLTVLYGLIGISAIYLLINVKRLS